MSAGRERNSDGSAPAPPHPVCIPDETGHCGVCGDQGLVARVLEVLDGEPTARARLEERERREGQEIEAALDLLDGVTPGDRIVVHMGFAIAVVRDEDGGAPGIGSSGGRRNRGPADAGSGGAGGSP